MKADRNSMLLYLVTDRAWAAGTTVARQTEEALRGGATFLQYREKTLRGDAFLAEALELKALARRYNVPFVINDDAEAALQIDADGVHVGQCDMSAAAARRLVGRDKIVGVSVQTAEQAAIAEREGADYLGVGAVFTTPTKPDAETVGLDTLKSICASVSIPVVAIGGINESNILTLKGSGADGAAVISAVFAATDIRAAAARLLTLSKEVARHGEQA
ncbi:MAG: thiamine phosphate synthase [Clostridiales bacterium]|jgi:thiamine-phosphate pyrophosphorylase|nr:thiamine phosphate synthase [Clostridiales bacterium]